MERMSIPKSVIPELAYIGTGTGKEGLLQRLGQLIGSPDRYLSPAEREAVAGGQRLEVSVAITVKAPAYRAALLLAYKDLHGRLPGADSPRTAVWVRGNRLTPSEPGAAGAAGDLDWSEWLSLDNRLKSRLPTEHGVYRTRVRRP